MKLLSDHDLREAVRDAIRIVDHYKQGFGIPDCDDDGACRGCAEESHCEVVIGRLKRLLESEVDA